MSRIIRRPAARDDATDIWLSIAIHDVAAADRVVEKLDRKIATLSEFPLTGRMRDMDTGLRSVPVGRYLILYFPLPDGVDVLRIVHGARDIDSLFRGD